MRVDLRVGRNETAACGFNGGMDSLNGRLCAGKVIAGDDVNVTDVLVNVRCHNWCPSECALFWC